MAVVSKKNDPQVRVEFMQKETAGLAGWPNLKRLLKEDYKGKSDYLISTLAPAASSFF